MHTYTIPNTHTYILHTYHMILLQKFTVGVSLPEQRQRHQLWFPGNAPLGTPFSCFRKSKSKKFAPVSMFNQRLYHNDLFCFLHSNQSILPRETAFCVSSTIVKKPIRSGSDKVMVFHIISLLRVSLS